MRIIAIEIQNLAGIGTMSGSFIPKGSLGITVDDYKFGRKAKRGWTLMKINPSQLKAAGYQNNKLFKIVREGRFLYSAPVTMHIGPKHG